MATKRIVNLKKQDKGQIVKITAKISKKNKNIPLYFSFKKVEEGGHTNVPLKFLRKSYRAGFGPERTASTKKITDDDGKAVPNLKFRLSCCGLDKFKVTVAKNRKGNNPLEAKVYEVWRKIFFSVCHKDPAFEAPLGSYAVVKTEYKNHGIYAEEEAPPAPIPKLIPAAVCPEVLESQGQVKMYELLPRRPSKEKNRRRVLIALVDLIWIPKVVEGEYETNQTTFTWDFAPLANRQTLTDTAGQQLTQSQWKLHPRLPTILHAEVTGPGLGVIDITQFVKGATGSKRITFDLSGNTPTELAVRAAAATGLLTYTFRLKLAKTLNGWANKELGRIVIASRGARTPRDAAGNLTPYVRAAADVLSTMVHEMGHGVGLVPKKIKQYDEKKGTPKKGPPKKHNLWYEHGGGHCKHGAPDPVAQQGDCVMYSPGYAGRPSAFCDQCGPILRRANFVPEASGGGLLWPNE